MADSKTLAPFILKWEGGYVNNPYDKGGETNKGITYNTWKQTFGDTHQRFIAMAPEDWNKIFKKNFWDAIKGDEIKSQKVANIMADWVWGSGVYYPVKHLQKIVGVNADGSFGPGTLAAVNRMSEDILFNKIVTDRKIFLQNIVSNDASQNVFLKGWFNRLEDLIKNNPTKTAITGGLMGLMIISAYLIFFSK